MPKNYTSLISELREKLKECNSPHDIANIKAYYLGKTGIITNEFAKLKDVNLEERKELGKSLNILKNQAQKLISLKLDNIQKTKENNRFVDVTLPGKNISMGSRHPISITINKITSILSNYGFASVSGIEI